MSEDIFEKDPLVFFNQYNLPILVYLEFVQKQVMGDPNLLGYFYFGGNSALLTRKCCQERFFPGFLLQY